MRRLVATALVLAVVAGWGTARGQSLTDDPAFVLYRQAAQAAEAKDFEKATQLAKEAIAQYPDHLLAWYLLGQAAMGRSAWEEAVVAFNNVIKRYPKSFAAHRDLGLALANLKRVDEARAAFDAALALRPDNDDTRLRLAFMLYDKGQRDAALPMLEELSRGKNANRKSGCCSRGRTTRRAICPPARRRSRRRWRCATTARSGSTSGSCAFG